MLKWHATHGLVDSNAIERVRQKCYQYHKIFTLAPLEAEGPPSCTLPPSDCHAFLLFAANEFSLKQPVFNFLQNL